MKTHSLNLASRRIHRLWRTVTGQSLTEFAMVVPVFFLLMFGIIDLGRVFYTQLTLQHAMRQAARLAVTGNKTTDASNPTRNRVDSIILAAKQAAVGLNVADSNIQISSKPFGTSGVGVTNGVARAGGPGEVVTIQMAADLLLITPMIGRFFGPDNTYHFTVQASFRNEPFPASQTAW
jgi:Flp pilus assembly protein TadG